jgi:alkanesulfonate monooxygenase SsuD/methylene tetrahydromethanopterin reductase-like flavin-dependent oxidoreductase (luciferase family)
MDIGLLLHTRQLIRSEDASKSFGHLWSDAVQAEELGFDHIWLGDSVTVLDKARGDCLTTMAALAARTSKIRLGIVPMLPALRNPVLLAHALATVDVISNGRIILGVSVGPVRDYIQSQFAACGVPPHPAQQPGIPIWIVADRNDTGFKRVARLGDGWVTLAPTLERFTGARAKIAEHAESYGRVGKLRESALYVTFNICEDAERAKQEGWQWMESFFGTPRTKLGHFFTIFSTPEECVGLLKGYIAAGLTTIIARIASDDMRGQANMLLNEIRPRL